MAVYHLPRDGTQISAALRRNRHNSLMNRTRGSRPSALFCKARGGRRPDSALAASPETGSHQGISCGRFRTIKTISEIGRFERDLLRREAKAYKLGANDDVSGEPRISGGPPVIGFRERATRNLEGILLVRADWRDQMCKHQIFRARALSHGTEVGD